jgi:hypothetical protein
MHEVAAIHVLRTSVTLIYDQILTSRSSEKICSKFRTLVTFSSINLTPSNEHNSIELTGNIRVSSDLKLALPSVGGRGLKRKKGKGLKIFQSLQLFGIAESGTSPPR